MANPLNLLRQFHINKQDIVERDGLIIFGEFSWEKDAKTNYLKYGSTKKNDPNEYYTLDCLLYLLKNISLSHSVYVKNAAAVDIPAVNRPDRKELLKFLNGEIKTCSSIDKSASIAIMAQPNKRESKKPQIEPKVIMDIITVGPNDASKVKSILDSMSAETIAALKAKHKANKRSIKATKDILKSERQRRSRNSILRAPNTSFNNRIKTILKSIDARKKFKVYSELQQVKLEPIKFIKTEAIIPKSTQYSRYDQEKFTQELDKEVKEEFKINTMGTHHPISFNEQPMSIKKEQCHEVLKFPKKQSSGTPIIIIPSSSTSLISMYNVKDILEDLKFVTTEEKKAQGGICDKEVLIIRRKSDNLSVPYRVVDQPSKLTPDEWNRVVAVFVLGPLWQFKNWPWNSDPTTIFSNIAGFHLKYDDMVLDKNVARWNVTPLIACRYKRYSDTANLKIFWDVLNEYMLKFNRI